MLVEIGRQIRSLRVQKNLRREDMAERAGLSMAYIGAIERGERNLTLRTLCKLGKALEESIITIQVF